MLFSRYISLFCWRQADSHSEVNYVCLLSVWCLCTFETLRVEFRRDFMPKISYSLSCHNMPCCLPEVSPASHSASGTQQHQFCCICRGFGRTFRKEWESRNKWQEGGLCLALGAHFIGNAALFKQTHLSDFPKTVLCGFQRFMRYSKVSGQKIRLLCLITSGTSMLK